MAFPYTDLGVTISAYLGADPTVAPGTWPAATDLSSRLLNESITARRGRSAGQRTLSSGQCTFWLDNSDGALTPLLASSPYYGTWDLGTPVAVAATGVGASPPYRRFCGFISAIEPTIVPGAKGYNKSIVKVTLGGVARRITQGAVAKSPVYRSVQRLNATHPPRAYWSMQEPGVPRDVVSGVVGTVLGSPTLAQVDDLPAGTTGALRYTIPDGDAGVDLTQNALVLPIGSYTPSGGSITLAFFMRQTTPDGFDPVNDNLNGAIRLVINSATKPSLSFVWNTGATPAAVGDGNSITYAQDIVDGQWHRIEVFCQTSGSNVNVFVNVDGSTVGSHTYTSVAVGQALQISTIQSWVEDDTDPMNPTLAGAAFDICHLAVYDEWSSTIYPATDAITAYDGELAHVRFGRICDEEGLVNSCAASDSLAVGPQPTDTAIAVLQDLEAVDHGVLSELVDNWGFGYLSSTQRYNLAAAITVDLSTYRNTGADSAQDVLVPVRNDQRIRNEWTISRPNGGSATVVDTAHQAKHGRYDDSDEVNVDSDDELIYEAAWRVWEGTYDGLRYAAVPLDLAANNGGTDGSPALLAAWLAANLGSRIDRTNPPAQHPNNAARLTIEGYTETITRRGWLVALTVEPYDPWDVRALADTVINTATDGWANWDSCTLHNSVSAGATSWSVDISSPASTAAANYPMVVDVEGERVTVTAVSGASSPQTWTVSRSTNGVSKAHSAGVTITSTELLIATL